MGAPLVILAIAIIIGFLIFNYFRTKARREALALFARQHGLAFMPGDTAVDEGDIGTRGFELMGRGHSRHASNALVGDHAGHAVTLFEYRYTTGSGKNQTTHHFTCCAWRLPVALTHTAIRPEGFFDRVAEWFGGNDIDFESEEFSRRFHVVGDDRREVYDMIDARMMAFLLDSGLENLEIVGDLALAHRDDNELTPPLCEWFLALTDGFCKNLPEHLLRRKRGQAVAPSRGGDVKQPLNSSGRPLKETLDDT